MIKVELNDDECAALKDVLSSYVSDTRMEIADTDSMEFREQLKRRKTIVAGVLEKLSA
jgi:hypothetical protein